jgi:hypothetical protein
MFEFQGVICGHARADGRADRFARGIEVAARAMRIAEIERVALHLRPW